MNTTISLLSSKKAELFFELIKNNKHRLEDFFAGTVKRTNTLSDTIQYCLEVDERISFQQYLPYLIIDEVNNKVIGFIDFKNIDWSIPKAELGAFIDLNYEGKGIVTKTFNNLLEEVIKKHQFKKLFCRISKDNTRSIRLALRCGFKQEGIIRSDYRTTKGELIDLNYYGKVI